MRDVLVAARLMRSPISGLFEDHRIQVVGDGQAELVEEVEVVPDADAVAVVAPRVVALVLRRGAAGRVGAEAGAEGEILDIVAEVDGEPLAARPV